MSNNESSSLSSPLIPRRKLLGQLAVGGVGAAMVAPFLSHEEQILVKSLAEETTPPPSETPPDAVSSATRIHTDWSKLSDLKEKCPQSKIGRMKLSRLILGGNLIGGWAHARDLLYVSDLVKAYHTREKIFATFQLAEACGVNMFVTNPVLCEVMEEYWKKTSGQMRYISDCGGSLTDLVEKVQFSIDHGADACYVQGGVADKAVATGNFEVIEKTLELTRKNGLPAGIGAHKLETLKVCVERGLIPDFWMKTYHHLNYWSAKSATEHDNVFCHEPDETRAFMASRPEPWIAFKILAAGAIAPKDGFKFALDGGADFLCVGMYDFQLVDDVNLFTAMAKLREFGRQPAVQ